MYLTADLQTRKDISEENELQLPAAFVLDESCHIEYVHYGKAAGDIPGVEELTELLAK